MFFLPCQDHICTEGCILNLHVEKWSCCTIPESCWFYLVVYLSISGLNRAHQNMRNPSLLYLFTKLLGLFSLFCFKCEKSAPRVTMKQRGTMVIVNQHCLQCGVDSFEWRSQPMTLGGRHAVGNVLLSFAVLMAGASISKVLCSHNPRGRN